MVRPRLMRGVHAADAALASAAAVVTAIEASLLGRYGPTWYIVANLALHVGLTGALLVRHVWRRGSFLVTYLLLAALAAVVWWSPVNLGVSPLVLCAPLSLYVVARHEPYRWAVAGLLLGVAGSFVSPLRRLPDGTGGGAWIPLMVLVLVGVFLWATGRRRTDLAYRERLQMELAERERRAQFRIAEAQADERARIARELHDIVAHSLAVVQVQASTGLALGDREPMRDALVNVRAASQEALAELRSLVHLLREDPGTSVSGDLLHLKALVQSVRDAGVELEASLPDADTLQQWQAAWLAPTRVTVLRIVQEALTNVLKHGGRDAKARLDVAVDQGWVSVEVTNDHADPQPEPGFGLIGLRERVALADGTLQAAPQGEGFRLHARLPILWEEGA